MTYADGASDVFDAASDTGLQCLASIAQFHSIPVDLKQLRHQHGAGGAPFTDQELLRAAKALSLKAKIVTTAASKLDKTVLPAIAKTRDGAYIILARASRAGDQGPLKILVHDMRDRGPRVVTDSELAALWAGEVLLLSPRSLAGTRAAKFDFSWFIPALVKYRKYFGEVLLASLFLQLFALATPLFFQVVMDKVLVHNGFTTLDVLAIGFFAVILFDALLGGIRTYVLTHTTNRVDVELGAKLFYHLFSLPLAYFEARQVGQSVARVRELETIRNFITGAALTLVIDLGFTFVFFAVMWYYSPLLTGIVLATLPFYIGLSAFITPILRRRLNDKFRYGAANQAFLVESVTGAQTIKSMSLEPQIQRRWENQLADYVGASFKSQNLGNIANQIAGFIGKLTTLLIIWWGAHLVISGELTVGQLVAFNMLAARISGPVLKLVQLWQEFQQAGISVQRLGDILNCPTEPGSDRSRSSLPEVKGEVVFDRVRFRYRSDGPLVLDDVSLTVEPSEIVGIVGRSGSGKSTLTKLIQRLYVPEGGRVLIDGVDLKMIDARWLRQSIGVVLQDSFLFHRSIRENIAIANPGLSMAAVVRVAQLAGAHDFILETPEGYDTLIDEQGSNLSGGQKQRIAIARALITDPRILIFDEATSALDYESERVIQENMASICEGRTVFIIAHRLSTVRNCDRILVMENGKITETGDHDALMAADRYYARLHSYQNHVPHIRRVREA